MSEHHCTRDCHDGLHAFACLCRLADTAADVLEAAQIWVAHLGWPQEVVSVQPARERNAAQILQSTMVEVDPATQTAREVTPTAVDLTCYRPWLVFLRTPAAQQEKEEP